MRFLTRLGICAFLAGALLAQHSTAQSLGPDGDTRVSINGIRILPVTGKPFSGSDSIDWTRTLEDGSVVAMHQNAKLARDGQGRIYREKVTRFPANSGQKSRVNEIIIMDPVAHTRTDCVMAGRRCNVTDYYSPTSFALPPAGAFDNGKRELSRESLGTDTIDGLNVVGTRETLTVNAGIEGNSQPLSSIEETWYSPDLEVNLLVTRRDPRQGTVVIHVVDLSRSEPDPSLFQIPANFLVEDHRQAAKSED
ncbi:MAG: hypothetical protein WBL50_23975 [Candidatus Acidiferrum sp.]